MLKDILNFRRAVRYYAPTPISEEKVRECLKLATLAPSGFNMQLYELYHITDKALLEKLAKIAVFVIKIRYFFHNVSRKKLILIWIKKELDVNLHQKLLFIFNTLSLPFRRAIALYITALKF